MKALFIPALLLLAVSVQAQKISLVKGQKIETVSSSKMSMEVMGQSLENEFASTSSLEVKDQNKEGYQFSNTLRRITVKGTAMGNEINFDSDKKEDLDGQMGQAIKGRINTPMDYTLDRAGKIVALSDTAQSPAGGGMGDMMNITGEMTKGQPFPYLSPLAGRQVKPGDSWTDSSGTAATLKTVTVYTLKSTGADGTVIGFSSNITKSGTIEQNGMEIQMDLSGVSKGESIYDSASGLLKTSASTAEFKGNMSVMGQSVPISATLSSSTTAKKI